MSMQPDEIAAAEALTLLDAGTSYAADTDAWRSKANTNPSSSQKPEVYNQHFPTLSDGEEKRLDQYIKAIREVRINVNSHGSLKIIQARIGGQAPKEVAECTYRDSMVEEVEELSKYLPFGKYIDSDGVDKEIQSRAPNLYELLHGLCRG
ncbi:hypothetical protein V8E54_014874 [Elaphomyces granulatus]